MMSATYYGTTSQSVTPARRWSAFSLAATALCAGAFFGLLISAAMSTTNSQLYSATTFAPRTTSVSVPVGQSGRTHFLQDDQAQMTEGPLLHDALEPSAVEATDSSAGLLVPSTTTAFQWALLAGIAGALASAAATLLWKPKHSAGNWAHVDLAMMAASGSRDYAGDMLKFSPLRDLVLAKVAAAEEKTTGGLVLPDVMQSKPTSGDVVAVGPKVTSLKGGECILYSKFGVGFTELEIAGESHILIRESDIIGVMPRSPANAKDTPELKPLLDKVLVKKDTNALNKPTGLILQSEDSDAKYITGEVVAVGGGWTDANGQFHEITVQPGQKVLFSKYAGDKLPTPSGPEYVCVSESELLGVM